MVPIDCRSRCSGAAEDSMLKIPRGDGLSGGRRPWYGRDPALAAKLAATRLQGFREALRGA